VKAESILIVDPESSSRELLRGMLDAHGYQVETAVDGAAALAIARACPPSLILLDDGLPGRDGVTTCARLRRDERSQNVPIIMLTVAGGATAKKIAALESGADDCVTKPYDPAELLARVRAHLRRLQRSAVPAIDASLQLDAGRRHAVMAERAVALTHREYALLDLLAQNAARLTSRAAIARDVWDGACEPDANVIEVYIRRLRHKLRTLGYAGRIRTVWGVGYMLEPAATPPAG